MELGKHFERSELIVVDDGSADHTAPAVRVVLGKLLYLARFRGHPTEGIPVRRHDEAGTKVDLRWDARRSLVGLAAIGVDALRDVYDSPREIHAPLGRWAFSGAEAGAGEAPSKDRR